MSTLSIFTACVFAVVLLWNNAAQSMSMMDKVQATVNNWTEHLHDGLVTLSEIMTRRRKVIKSFKNTRIVKQNGTKLLDEIAKDIRHMMGEKVNAVKRIKMHAEALSCQREPDIESKSDFDFFDADSFTNTTSEEFSHLNYLRKKQLIWKFRNPNNMPYPGADKTCEKMLDSYRNVTEASTCSNKPIMPKVETDNVMLPPGEYRNLTLKHHPHFGERVNLNFSVVRSTVSVFTRDKVVLNNIRWSEPLDVTFKCNREQDPTLIWQYFASSSGFMRLYPAMEWPKEDYDRTYDHRTRAWYTESMTSPKDMIILLDRSGSMTGKRKLISRQIVHDILDTLADNDYVNLLTFSNTTDPLITCFNDTLVQANEENLRLIRENLTQYEVQFDGRMDLAFQKAFEILRENPGKRSGHFCTQVIMVIAEGVDYFDQAAFDMLKKLNVEDENNCRVRIFTYLLETLQSDADIMLKIACLHMGYFVNISDVAEIREKVNMYTNVLSRSVNLKRDPDFQPIWSALYVDLADRRLTNWLWQKAEGLRQREIFVNYARIKTPKAFTECKNPYEQYLVPRKYLYLTTVSLPVYDKREDMTQLLGVAAVDVPIEYMRKLTKPYKLGVNGYAFIITNNGYVLMHPDHRTSFKTILKPTFNRVDVTEVELSNETVNPREFDANILKLREDIVTQKDGTTRLVVMTHMDDMKRIFFTTRHYYYTKIEPYSLVVALQDNYGHNKLEYNFYEHFSFYHAFIKRENESWTLHPDWLYFKGMKTMQMNDSGKSVKEILKEYLLMCDNNRQQCLEDPYFELLTMLLEDLKSTCWFENSISNTEINQSLRHYVKFEYLYNASIVAFMSTHSGLTRWQYRSNDKNIVKNFNETDGKSIDEIWYKMAVEEKFAYPDNITYIFSIPLVDEMDEIKEFNQNQVVTITQAILKEERNEDGGLDRTPVAVVGYQLKYSALRKLFQDLQCEKNINFGIYAQENISCVILDNHGYILWSNNDSNVGRLILHHSINLTQKLENGDIFRPTNVFDYQGICLPNATVKSCPASGAEKCRKTMHNETIEYQKRAIQKTVPTPCDKEMRMYTYTFNNTLQKEDPLCPYIIQFIPNTNLALLVYETNCHVDNLREELKETYPKEKKYGETGKLHLPCFIETNNNYFKRPYINCIMADKKEKSLNNHTRYCGGNQKHVRDEL